MKQQYIILKRQCDTVTLILFLTSPLFLKSNKKKNEANWKYETNCRLSGPSLKTLNLHVKYRVGTRKIKMNNPRDKGCPMKTYRQMNNQEKASLQLLGIVTL